MMQDSTDQQTDRDSDHTASAHAVAGTDSSDNRVTRFDDLSLPEPLLRAVDEAGFEHCTEIQGLTLPVIMENRDVAAQAQTGTGKTAAFLLGAMTLLLNRPAAPDRPKNQPRMLVIAPTRELAIQIGRDAENLGQFTDFRIQVVYGGKDYEKQREAVQAGVDILIGTPGRLIDYFKQRAFHLKDLEICVLDEADRMFDLGFIADIRYLLRRMPAPDKRTNMLFSATLSNRVMELSYEHMNNPETIKTATTSVTADGIRQVLYHPAADEKISLLVGLLRELQPSRAIVFVNTRRAADQVEASLLANEIECGTLSGDVRQSKRQSILRRFTQGELPILIATDVAARGLHIDDVTHVFNFDLPQQAEDYVHRIGRTARAGTRGEALSFACEEYAFSLPEIIQYIGHPIDTESITSELLPELVQAKRLRRRSSRGASDSQGRPKSGRRRPAGGDRGRRPGRSSAGTGTTRGAEEKSTDTDSSANSDKPAKKRSRRRRRRARKPADDSNIKTQSAD